MTIDQNKLWAGFRWAGEHNAYGLQLEDGKVGVRGLIPPQSFEEWGRELGRASHMAHQVKDISRAHKATKGELLLMNLMLILEALSEATEAENLRQPLLGLVDAITYLLDNNLKYTCACHEEPTKDRPHIDVKLVEVRSPEEFAEVMRHLQNMVRGGGTPFTPPSSGTLN